MTSEYFACNFSFIKYEYSIGTKFKIQYKIYLYNFLFIKLKPKKTEKMKTKQEQIKDLIETANLLRDAYSLQNRAMCILIENYEIDNKGKYLQNPFFKIRECDTHTALYKAETMCYELCMELEKQIKEELNNK